MENQKIRRRLLPSKRPKKRYIAFKIVTDEKFNVHQIVKFIQISFMKCVGEEARQKSNFYFFINKYDITNKRGLIKTTPRYQKKMVEMLNNIQIDNSKIMFKTLGVSGSIKKAYNKYIAS